MKDKSDSNGQDNTISDLLDVLIIIAGMDVIGEVRITAQAHSTLKMRDINKALVRHLRGDWGDVTAEDARMNEWAIRNDGRVLSVYHTPKGITFWIVTEGDRSSTLVLLPDDN